MSPACFDALKGSLKKPWQPAKGVMSLCIWCIKAGIDKHGACLLQGCGHRRKKPAVSVDAADAFVLVDACNDIRQFFSKEWLATNKIDDGNTICLQASDKLLQLGKIHDSCSQRVHGSKEAAVLAFCVAGVRNSYMDDSRQGLVDKRGYQPP